ncbi:MAG: hypothetical protein M3162_03040 [Thermoproteota archaeon]|nr:hypothetical protein [Thermoproteota archaeon]
MDKESIPPNDEKVIMQEDCSEDKLKNGILTLTNKRIVFEKTKGKIATFSKKTLDERVELQFNDISLVKSEGIIIKKLVISLKNKNNNNTYKFGVLSPSNWVKKIKLQLDGII